MRCDLAPPFLVFFTCKITEICHVYGVNISSAIGATPPLGHTFGVQGLVAEQPRLQVNEIQAKTIEAQADAARRSRQDARVDLDNKRAELRRVAGQRFTSGRQEGPDDLEGGDEEGTPIPGQNRIEAAGTLPLNGQNSKPQGPTGANRAEQPVVEIPIPGAQRGEGRGPTAVIEAFQERATQARQVQEKVVQEETRKAEEKKQVEAGEVKKQESERRTVDEERGAQLDSLEKRSVEVALAREKSQQEDKVRTEASERDAKEGELKAEARNKVFLDVQRRLADVFLAQSRLPFVGKNANVRA